MRAAVVHEPGGPEALRLEDRPIPALVPGWALVRVRAFGLNRAELFTRAGLSGPAVKFPRVIGIECAGEVADADSPVLMRGQTVIAAMGGMGRDFDGGYEEYALLPAASVIPVRTTLSWPQLGAVPETFGTAWGSLTTLELEPGQTLLVRGATSSVGMAAITLAKGRGARVVATTRQPAKRAALEADGADDTVLDDGAIAGRVRELVPGGIDALLELVGPRTMLDSLRTLRRNAHVCLTGVLEQVWDDTEVRAVAQQLGINFHRFGSNVINRASYGAIFQDILENIENGRYRLNLDRTFALSEIVEAHRYMEANRATGKVVGIP